MRSTSSYAELTTAFRVVAVALMLWAMPARAETPAQRAAAEASFEEGQRLAEAGKLEQACAKFVESQRLSPAPGTLLNLADCYERRSMHASAWVEYRAAAAAAHDKGQTKREQYALRRASLLASKVARLELSVVVLEGMVITLDGSPIGRGMWSTGVPVDAGGHSLVASAPGHIAWSTEIQVRDGAVVKVPIPQLLVEPSAPPVEQPPGLGATQIAGLVVGAVGLAAVGVGSGFGVNALDVKAQSDEGFCNAAHQCTSEGLELRKDARSSADISTWLMVAGGAAITGGVVLYLVGGNSNATAPEGVAIVPFGLGAAALARW